MKIETASRTVVGRERDHNEDAVYTGKIADKTLLIVADGMGGHQAGDIASELAVETVVQALTDHDWDKAAHDETPDVLLQAVNLAHKAVSDRAASNPELEGMGTTIVAALIDGTTVAVVNVGDSRAYHIRDDGIEQVTTDHSVAQQLVEQGTLTPAEAADHPQRHVLTQAIGTDSNVDPEIVQFSFDGTVLLCSDGLTDEVPETFLKKVIAGGESLSQAATQLTDRADQIDGSDNISVVLSCPSFHNSATNRNESK